MNDITINPKGEVWIFAEQEQGVLSEIPLELLSKGRELADQLGVPLAAVLLGDKVDLPEAAAIGMRKDPVSVFPQILRDQRFTLVSLRLAHFLSSHFLRKVFL